MNELFNPKNNEKYNNLLLEQYKIMVESANKTSERRDNTNKFYITINTAILSIAGYLNLLNQPDLIRILIPLLGIIISINWYRHIESYKNLNTGKYAVICELEKRLPAKLFGYEWEVLGEGKTKSYKQTTEIELIIPTLLILAYMLIFIQTSPSLIVSSLKLP